MNKEFFDLVTDFKIWRLRFERFAEAHPETGRVGALNAALDSCNALDAELAAGQSDLDQATKRRQMMAR